MTSIAHVVAARGRDLGGFAVRRVLPWGGGRMIGPFIFLDQMGPVNFAPGQGIDVRPHPHIGLATVTYLFEGELVHRDSLGVVQTIRPGDVNWMTAGRGIVHSERTSPEMRASGQRMHGLQSWVALPVKYEEAEPAFDHTPAAKLPEQDGDGVKLRVIAGRAFGLASPVRVFSGMFYVDAAMSAGAALSVPEEYAERAAYVLQGTVASERREFGAGTLLIFTTGSKSQLVAQDASRVAVLGGAPLEGKRHIWWNFVSSSGERIEQAKRQWAYGAFPQVPGETEFIPLPER
jgi:redox-sensitive bicupin YhaK (pirin superfamily)